MIVYCLQGALWFSPLFGRLYDLSLGFERPDGYLFPFVYYVIPLLSALLASIVVLWLSARVAVESTWGRLVGRPRHRGGSGIKGKVPLPENGESRVGPARSSVVLPDQKAAQIRQPQQDGTRVLMVGDGINDAPALTQAHIGVAIGAGTDIAIESADIVVMSDRFGSVLDAHQIGVSSYRKTKQNLALAFSFNGIGVSAAITGLVSPVWAMISSVTAVLANSFGGQLLRGKHPTPDNQTLTQDDHHQDPEESEPIDDVERNRIALSTRAAVLNLRRLVNLGLTHNADGWTLPA